MRRYELRDLNLIIKQCGHSLFGLAHDAKDDFVGSLFVLLPHRMTGIFADHQALTRDQLAKFERTGAYRILAVSNLRAVFVISRFVGNHDPIKKVIEEGRRPLLSGDSHRVLINHRLAGNRGDVLALLA